MFVVWIKRRRTVIQIRSGSVWLRDTKFNNCTFQDRRVLIIRPHGCMFYVTAMMSGSSPEPNLESVLALKHVRDLDAVSICLLWTFSTDKLWLFISEMKSLVFDQRAGKLNLVNEVNVVDPQSRPQTARTRVRPSGAPHRACLWSSPLHL